MTNQDTTWVTIREAALRLGVSELTIRRRIKDRKLRSKLHGGKYYVWLGEQSEDFSEGELPAGQPPDQDDHNEQVASAWSQSDAWSSILGDYSRLAETAGRVSVLEEELTRVRAEYAELQRSVVTLATRNGWLESKLEDREAEIKLLTDNERRASWWRRLFGGDGAV